MEIQKTTGADDIPVFTFITNKKTVDISAPSLLDAKLEFQVRFGYWPEGSPYPSTRA